MSSSRRSDEVDEAQEQLLQERLHILLERLRWSYAALWTLNSYTRVLQWKRGQYFQVETSTSQPKLAWSAQHFYTLYRSCFFAPGTGFVGRANLEGRHMWLSGESVWQNAGSLEQSQFLRNAKVKTVICIPWLDSVLELGTTNFVRENFQLMDQIQQVLSHDLLMVPGLQEADDHYPGFAAGHHITCSSHAAAAAMQQQQAAHSITEPLQLPDPAQLNQPGNSNFQSAFDINPSDQVWRSDMLFMHEQDSLPDLTIAWRAVEVEGNETQHKNINAAQHEYSTRYGLINSSTQAHDQYGSCSDSFAGTTLAAVTASSSTSVSSHRDRYSYSSNATRPAASSVSPEVLHQQIMHPLSPPISPSIAPNRTSSTVKQRQGQLQDEAYNVKHGLDATAGARNQNDNLRRTSSCSDQYDIQKALSLFEVQEMQDQRRQRFNAISEATDPNILGTPDQFNVSSHSWQHGHDPVLSTSLSNQSNIRVLRKQLSKIPRASQLQRRHTLPAMEVLKAMDTYQQEAANSNVTNSSELDYFQIQANQPAARPAVVQMINTPNLRGRPRIASSSRSSGAQVAAGHDEAAMSHMLAERRRRVKQKENFATLRRLVPIISKADKASTLIDSIVYLKDLQNTIVELKTNKDIMVQRCEELASKCMELENQNTELMAILSKDKSQGGVVHLNHLNLHSMKSI